MDRGLFFFEKYNFLTEAERSITLLQKPVGYLCKEINHGCGVKPVKP